MCFVSDTLLEANWCLPELTVPECFRFSMNSPPELSMSIWCQTHVVTASAQNQCLSINYTIWIGPLTSEELYDKQKRSQSWPLNTCRSSFGELVKANSNVQLHANDLFLDVSVTELIFCMPRNQLRGSSFLQHTYRRLKGSGGGTLILF